MKSKITLFFVLVSLLVYSVRGAEIPEFTFRHYSAKDGLSSNAVLSMIQDRQGLIWMGTADGLNSFDGRSFRHYPLPDEAASCTVNCIVETSDGRLWLGTDDAVYSFDGKSFSRIRAYEGVEPPHSIVMSMAEDHDGNLWISTREQGVFRYTPSTGALANYLSDLEEPNIEAVYVDSNNIVWAAPFCGDHALYVLNHAEGVFVPAKMNYRGCAKDRIYAITGDASGNMWMGTWSSGLYCYSPSSKDVTAYVADGSMKGFSHCHSLNMTAPMTFLIGSDDGLLWYNVASGENRLYVNDADNPKSLSNRFVYPVLQDREGGIWIGTYYGGADYLSSNSGRFQNWSMTEMTGGTEGYTIACFMEDPDGTVWIGSDNGGLMHFDPETGKALDYITPTHSTDKLSSLNVHAICRDGRYLWVGTYAGSLNRIDLTTGRTKVYANREGLYDSSIYALGKDDAGRLWAATMLGIHVYDSENDRFVPKIRLDVTTTQIVMTKDGRLWFATSGRGLYVYDPSLDQWTNYSASTSGLDSDYVNYIFKFPENKLYIGTKSGLNIMDADSGEISRIDLNGEKNVSFIAAYGNQLWLSTQHGLLRYQPQDGTMEHFTSADGIESDQFLQGSGLLASDGRIYVGATSGFVSFYPYRMTRNSYVPPVLISSVRVREPKRKDSFPEYAELSLEESMTLSHRQKDVVFDFAALSYSAPEKNAFKCRLDGLDDQWRNLGDQSWIEYTNLPAGRYTFRVMASNNDGVWNEEGTSYSFTVRPHPLLSNFALIVYVIIFCILMYLLVRYMTRRSALRYQEMYDRMLVQRKEEDLDRKVNFVTSIAHEIRTPLSLITAPLERIKSRGAIPAAIESDLSVIDKNSRRLLMLVNQILDFSRINSETLNIRHPEYRSIPMIVRQVTENFLPTFESRGIEFIYNAPKDDFKADVDEESLNKIVSNLLSNAVKYTDSLVAVTLTRDSGNYTVRVRDNGPGISEEVRSKVFTPFFRIDETKQGTGLGLAIVRKLVETAMGRIELRAAEGGGSEFIVVMPLTSFTAARAVEEPVVTEPEEDSRPADTGKLPDADLPVMLVVEDDKDLRDFLADDFSGEYSVLTASDGNEAVSLLGTRNVSIVITDWMMPGMQGDELCRYIRSHKEICHIPSIMLTAKSDDNSALASLNCGADAFVKKPFSVEHLHALARHLLSIRDMLSQKYSGEPPARNGDIAAMSNDSFLSKLSEIIDANIANTELSVAMLANEMCVSRSGLFAKVKESTSDTPNNLIVNARLKAAAKLLDSGKYPINEICYMVGFNSPSYFSRSFGKYFGLTPHQWMTRSK